MIPLPYRIFNRAVIVTFNLSTGDETTSIAKRIEIRDRFHR